MREMSEKRKLFWLSFIFIFSSFILHSVFFRESLHSEGLMMVSDIGEKILGINFEKNEFIFSLPREERILPFLSIVKQDFFPYLKIRFFSFEIPILWKEYHGGILAFFFKFLDKVFFFLSDFWRDIIIKIVFFHLFVSFFLIYFLLKIFEEYFFVDKKVVYSMIFFVMTSSIFYFFSNQIHHSQAGIFLLGMMYFLKKRNYFWGGILGGLAIYSYLPIVFAILGFSLTALFFHRNIKGLILISFISLIFSAPHIYYIFSSHFEDFNQIYGCSDCVGLFPPYGLKYYIKKEGLSFYDLSKILFFILTSLFFLIFRISETLYSVLYNIKESFSVSDVMIRYGILVSPPPLKTLSDISIYFHLFILAIGIIYMRRRFEVVAYVLSTIIYYLLSRYFLLVPKMIYILFPIYVIIVVRVFFEFASRNMRFFTLILVISSFLRLSEFIDLSENIKANIRFKENYEVINFFEDKNVRSEDILLYCLPPPFKSFTNGKLNPPVLLLFFEKIEPDMRMKTIDFVIKQSTFRYIVFDNVLLKFIPYNYFADLEKINFKIVFRNNAFFIAEIERPDKR